MISVIPNSPFVNVPVLSKMMASIFLALSKAVLSRINKPFDSDIAIRIRKKAGHKSRYSIGKHLGIYPTQVARVEDGKLPKKPQAESTLKYLNWLKEQGYNPLNL